MNAMQYQVGHVLVGFTIIIGLFIKKLVYYSIAARNGHSDSSGACAH